MTETLTRISKAIGWISRVRKLQKKKFKELHQQTFAEEVKDSKRQVAVEYLKSSVQAIESSSSIVPTVKTVNSKWTPKSEVRRSLYVKRIMEYVAESELKWATASDRQRTGLVFLRAGKPINILSMPFFNDTVHGDDEIISWTNFKTSVFYEYLKNLSDNIAKIKKEIKARNAISNAFKELAAALSKEIINSSDAKENKSTTDGQGITFGALKKKLASYKVFDEDSEFWTLACWDESNAETKITEEEFNDQWLGKTMETLQSTLKDLEEEQRININENIILLTKKKSPAAEEKVEEKLVEEDTSDVTIKKEELKEKFIELARKVPGVPKDIGKYYVYGSQIVQQILRKLINVARKKSSSLDSLDVIAIALIIAADLLQNNYILFTKARNESEILLQKESRRYLQISGKAKISTSLLETVDTEHKEEETKLLAALQDLKRDYEDLNTVFRNNYRQLLRQSQAASADSATATDPNTDTKDLVSVSSFKNMVRFINRFYNPVPLDTPLPAQLSYGLEMHEVDTQAADEPGYLYALKAIKEWQDYNAFGSLDRLSVPFLKVSLAEYNPDPDDRSLADALEIVKRYGIVNEELFATFTSLGKKTAVRSHAQLLLDASKHSIDTYLRVRTSEDLKDALYAHGPALLTLPVYTRVPTTVSFWTSSVDDAPVQGYHDVVVTGYNDESRTFTIRNSRGKSYGKLGYSEISYDDAFGPLTVATIAIDGGNRRESKSLPIVPLDPFAAKLANAIALVENS